MALTGATSPTTRLRTMSLPGAPDGNSIACSPVTQLRHQEAAYILQKTETVAGKVRIDGDSNLAQMLLDWLVYKIGGRE